MSTTDDREKVQTPSAPAAIGPYSQAVRVGDTLFCSGQIPLDPATGVLVEGDFKAQAEQVLANIEAVVRAAGFGMDDVVRTTVFLVDLADFAVLNELYALRFREPFPARVTVGVASLPKGARIELDAIAVRKR
jgi:2-iminobutanoate/2-iminopropanoate deaminase